MRPHRALLHRLSPSLALGALLLGACGDSLDASAPPWTRVVESGPSARWGHVALWDRKRDRMIVYAGQAAGGDQLDDVWAFDLATDTWSQLATVGAPAARTDLAAILDEPRDRLVAIGGRVGLATSIDEVWALDLASLTWRRVPSGPSPRHDIPAATDSGEGGSRAWVFGGAGALFQSLDDLWQLDLATDTWRQLPNGSDHPAARGAGALVFAGQGLLLDGGHDVSMVQRDTWRYDTSALAWSRVPVAGRSAAGAHFGIAFDPTCGALFLTGGDNLDNADVSFTDALSLAAPGGPRFVRVPASSLPPPRDHASLVLDGARRRLVLFGGGRLGDGLGVLGDTWTYAIGGCP